MELVIIRVVFFTLAALFLILGYLLFFKHMIKFMHSYHYKNVEDEVGYTQMMGIGLFCVGLGSLIGGILSFFISQFICWIVAACMALVGFIVLIIGQVKYNKGLF